MSCGVWMVVGDKTVRGMDEGEGEGRRKMLLVLLASGSTMHPLRGTVVIL